MQKYQKRILNTSQKLKSKLYNRRAYIKRLIRNPATALKYFLKLWFKKINWDTIWNQIDEENGSKLNSASYRNIRICEMTSTDYNTSLLKDFIKIQMKYDIIVKLHYRMIRGIHLR